MPAESTLLSVDDLTVNIRGRGPVLRGVSLELGTNETMAIVGESGSGKTMLAMSIMRLLNQSQTEIVSGSITLKGTDLLQLSPAELRRVRGEQIAMIFQDPLSSLNPTQRIGQQIGEMFVKHRGYAKARARAEAISLLERVAIANPQERVDDYPHQLSGGMRQRVMIAMAIALNPSVLVADEPTTALDVTVQKQIMQLIAEVRNATSMSMIFITHDLRLAATAADRIAVMYAGRIVEAGRFEDVYTNPKHPYTVALLNSIPGLGSSKRDFHTIEGSPPEVGKLPGGCAFHPRCPIAFDRCRVVDPPVRKIADAPHPRIAACHAVQPLDEVSDVE